MTVRPVWSCRTTARSLVRYPPRHDELFAKGGRAGQKTRHLSPRHPWCPSPNFPGPPGVLPLAGLGEMTASHHTGAWLALDSVFFPPLNLGLAPTRRGHADLSTRSTTRRNALACACTTHCLEDKPPPGLYGLVVHPPVGKEQLIRSVRLCSATTGPGLAVFSGAVLPAPFSVAFGSYGIGSADQPVDVWFCGDRPGCCWCRRRSQLRIASAPQPPLLDGFSDPVLVGGVRRCFRMVDPSHPGG